LISQNAKIDLMGVLSPPVIHILTQASTSSF
jgi:hypothetical protein